MRRITVDRMREGWQKRLEAIGFTFYEIDSLPYWDESAYYSFSADEIDYLEETTEKLYQMCLELVDRLVAGHDLSRLAIPEKFHDYVRWSWTQREPSLYGRFDLRFDGQSPAKLLEFNGDTPTALFEASVVQYYWLQDYDNDKDQFNSIHEKLLDVMKDRLRPLTGGRTVFFSSVKENVEDFTTTEYLRDVAIQGGIETAQVFIDDIGYDGDNGRFVDLDNNEISFLFKLYPWEWLVREEFADHILRRSTRFFEPPWKMILSNKAILPLLWEMFPGHENLLPSYFQPPNDRTLFVEKPFFSREGQDIVVADTFAGGKRASVYQKYEELPAFDGHYPVVGSWIIGSNAAGIGIREDTTPVTNNLSRFVPHLFE